jgi:predicted nicotinamide N-methyase
MQQSDNVSVSESLGEAWADIDSVGSLRSRPKSSKLLKAVSLALIVFVQSSISISALAFNTPVENRFKQSHYMMMSSQVLDDGTNVYRNRRRRKLGKVPIVSRTVSIDVKVPPQLPKKEDFSATVYSGGDEIKTLDVTVWEMDKPSDLIQEWWSIDQSERDARVGDPFGVVMWPGSISAAKEMMKMHHSPKFKSPIYNATVLVLGAGTGVEAQTAALLGAKRVIATDINPLTLKLLEYGANDDPRIDNTTLEGKYFDLFSEVALPTCDILIAADVLYNPKLAKQVGRRLHEAIVRSFVAGESPTKVIITDSQQFHGTNFLEEVPELRELNAMFKEGNYEELRWVTQTLERVCGSGVLVDEDQTYDVDVRMISWGW